MLQKFWNLNQVAETQYSAVKYKIISNIYDKADGSLITFIKLPNNKIIAKTKGGFDNSQAIEANIKRN